MFFLFGRTAAAQETPIRAGDLIKGPEAAIYSFGNDGKRYVYPNAATYFTWYSNFIGVRTLTAEQLSILPLGGNMTYRPGVRLIKINTDPKVYAVDFNGILRWVTTADVATALYGSQWNTYVDDLPDSFFTNYKVGSPILKPEDYPIRQDQTSIAQAKQSGGTSSLRYFEHSTSTPVSIASQGKVIIELDEPTDGGYSLDTAPLNHKGFLLTRTYHESPMIQTGFSTYQGKQIYVFQANSAGPGEITITASRTEGTTKSTLWIFDARFDISVQIAP